MATPRLLYLCLLSTYWAGQEARQAKVGLSLHLLWGPTKNKQNTNSLVKKWWRAHLFYIGNGQSWCIVFMLAPWSKGAVQDAPPTHLGKKARKVEQSTPPRPTSMQFEPARL